MPFTLHKVDLHAPACRALRAACGSLPSRCPRRLGDPLPASPGRQGAAHKFGKPARKRSVKWDQLRCLAQGGQPKRSGVMGNVKCGMKFGAFILYAFLLLLFGFPPAAPAGDILRGGATSASGSQAAAARANAGAAAAALANTKAQDRLSRTTQVINAMRQMQASAHTASATVNVPDGLVTGGLERLPGGTWTGANLPIQSGGSVNIQQTGSQALLDWKTFNVGRNTTVNL